MVLDVRVVLHFTIVEISPQHVCQIPVVLESFKLA
jgi:hypothetical protein